MFPACSFLNSQHQLPSILSGIDFLWELSPSHNQPYLTNEVVFIDPSFSGRGSSDCSEFLVSAVSISPRSYSARNDTHFPLIRKEPISVFFFNFNRWSSLFHRPSIPKILQLIRQESVQNVITRCSIQTPPQSPLLVGTPTRTCILPLGHAMKLRVIEDTLTQPTRAHSQYNPTKAPTCSILNVIICLHSQPNDRSVLVM